MVELAGNLLLLVATALNLEMILKYHRLSQGGWRDLPMGRHAMAYMATSAVILVLSTVRVVMVGWLGYSDPVWFQAVRLLVFTALPVVFLWRRHLMVQVHEQAMREEGHDG